MCLISVFGGASTNSSKRPQISRSSLAPAKSDPAGISKLCSDGYWVWGSVAWEKPEWMGDVEREREGEREIWCRLSRGRLFGVARFR